MDTPTLDGIMQTVNEVRDHVFADEYAFNTAHGSFADDVAEGQVGCVATVYQGKLFSLSISDAYLTLPPEELGLLISSVIVNAFEQWTQDVTRLHAFATSVLEENGPEEGRQHLLRAQS